MLSGWEGNTMNWYREMNELVESPSAQLVVHWGQHNGNRYKRKLCINAFIVAYIIHLCVRIAESL